MRQSRFLLSSQLLISLIVLVAIEQEFRREMNYFDMNITKEEIPKLSSDFKEFILSCRYEGELCNAR